MTPTAALVDALGVLAGGALLTLVTSRSKTLAGWVALIATAVAGGLAAVAAITVLRDGPASVTCGQAPLLFDSGLRLYIDGLSAIFLGLIALISTLAACYSIAYMRHYRDYGVGRYYPNLLLFVAGMYAIVTVTDMMVYFCLAWQLMTIPSFLLVRFEHRRPESVRAAWRYLVMMELACLLVMAGTWVLGQGAGEVGGLARHDFDALSQAVPGASGLRLAAALALFLVGFGIKAGMWPFGQLWLPDAHPAAPSPISALLSGVMIKTGIYGLMRSFLWLIPAQSLDSYPSREWGFLIALLGTLTLFIGTMQALKQEQTKRLLAFHSIGQIGYILLGLGACLALMKPSLFNPATLSGIATVAFLGALFHTINHATFKSLLFLNAGTMLHATGTQDLNRLGGLMKYMPVTAVTALIASLSIAGVPGCNGFASKWTIYVATILTGGSARYLPFFGLVAILTSALTLASFLKFFGMAFLSRQSQLVGARAHGETLDPGPLMRWPQIILAVICVLVGLLPAWSYGVMSSALHASRQGLAERLAWPAPAGSLIGVDIGGVALLGPAVFALVLLALILLARQVSRLGDAQRRPAEAWLCGYAPEAESNRYAAHGLYGEIKRHFGWLGGSLRPTAESPAGGERREG